MYNGLYQYRSWTEVGRAISAMLIRGYEREYIRIGLMFIFINVGVYETQHVLIGYTIPPIIVISSTMII